ncbi:hypothetical protein R5W24_002680 [Gemmata sp. JC717]|uniref:hypothetical protein n=1 Tax=Gemmata algarum TaxID=2975278 RepID=UPI0021BB767C|nr:hypothetical protein [Gemmata algarum]MDY3553577.1 hypothetical protein [Gemmata algarum]
MRAAVLALVTVGLVGSPGTTRAADDPKELVVGVWELVFSDAKDVPVGTRLEFTRDGKVKMTVRTDGNGPPVEDTYSVEKDVLTLGGPDRNKRGGDSGRIRLLNKTTLVLHDEREDKVLVLKRVHSKK